MGPIHQVSLALFMFRIILIPQAFFWGCTLLCIAALTLREVWKGRRKRPRRKNRC